jgi:preprotein translocase subunit YajC
MPAQPSPLMSFFPVIVVCAILYFMVIRPQQKQAKELRKMLDALNSGDKVLTQGGLYGTVMNLKGSVVILKIAENVKVEIARNSITNVVVEPTPVVPSSPQEVVR